MANPNQYQSYTSTWNTPQSLPCYYVQTWNNNLLAPVPVPNMTLTVQRENTTIVPPPPTTGNIIILQSQNNQLPSVTYAQLPYAHYVLVRSQANPNEFQIVSELTSATSYPTYLSRGHVQTMEYTESLHTNPNATALETPTIRVIQTNTSSFPHQIQVGDGKALEKNACVM